MKTRSTATPVRAAFYVVFILAVAFIAIGIAGCRGKGEESRKPEASAAAPSTGVRKTDKTASVEKTPVEKAPDDVEKPERPELKVVTRDVTLNWEEAGKPKMQATAREIVGSELDGKGTMKDAKVLWYDNGQLTTVMTAPRIEAQQSTRILTASGGVVVRSIQRKTVVKAQWLKWFTNDHKIIGNGGVTVTSEMGTVKAAALVADTELKTLKFTSQGGGGSASVNPDK